MIDVFDEVQHVALMRGGGGMTLAGAQALDRHYGRPKSIVLRSRVCATDGLCQEAKRMEDGDTGCKREAICYQAIASCDWRNVTGLF
jgi:hypothetical protein